MGLIIGGVPPRDLILDGSSVSLYEGGSPPVKVWPTRETVQITLGTGTQAQSQLRAALTARGLDYTTVTEIPFDIELVGTGSVTGMFLSYSALTEVPEMDTSQVTDMNAMFQGCSSLTTIPEMDTSQVTDMVYMFRDCSSLTHVPDLNTSNVWNVAGMFYNCSALTDGNVLLYGKHPNVLTTNMISGSGLTREPFAETVQITLGTRYEARNQFRAALADRGLTYQTVTRIPFVIELVGSGSAQDMFYDCAALTSVPDMDTSNVTRMDNMFYGCSSLTHVPDLNTSNVTTMLSMFRDCRALTYVPDMDTAQVLSTYAMFYSCAALTDGNVRLIGRHPNVLTTNMISGSRLTREPFYDTNGNPI